MHDIPVWEKNRISYSLLSDTTGTLNSALDLTVG